MYVSVLTQKIARVYAACSLVILFLSMNSPEQQPNRSPEQAKPSLVKRDNPFDARPLNPLRVQVDRRPSGKPDTTEGIFKEIDDEFKQADRKKSTRRPVMSTQVEGWSKEDFESTARTAQELKKELEDAGWEPPSDTLSPDERLSIARRVIEDRLRPDPGPKNGEN